MVVAMPILMLLTLVGLSFMQTMMKIDRDKANAAVEVAAAETLKRAYDSLIDGDPKTDPLRAVDYHEATDRYGIEVNMTIEHLRCINVEASNARGVEATRRLCSDFPVFDEDPEAEKLDAFGNPL